MDREYNAFKSIAFDRTLSIQSRDNEKKKKKKSRILSETNGEGTLCKGKLM